MDDPLGHGFVQHLLVPLLQTLGLGDLLVHGVAVEDVVVPLAGRTGPDVARGVAGNRTAGWSQCGGGRTAATAVYVGEQVVGNETDI